MFNWMRRKRLSSDGRRRLLLVGARAEEAMLDTHVANLLDLLETLDDEVDMDRGVELYAEMMGMDESRASLVANRLLAKLDDTRARTRRFNNVFRG